MEQALNDYLRSMVLYTLQHSTWSGVGFSQLLLAFTNPRNFLQLYSDPSLHALLQSESA